MTCMLWAYLSYAVGRALLKCGFTILKVWAYAC